MSDGSHRRSHRRTGKKARNSPATQSDSSDPGRAGSGAPAIAGTGPGKATGVTAGEIIGLRCWRVREGNRLFSVYFETNEWIPGSPLTASKVAEPGEGCALEGIHAFKLDDYVSLREYMVFIVPWGKFDLGVVWGTVELWGTVWEHKYGYRAQYARPLTFDGCEVPGFIWPDSALEPPPLDMEVLRARYRRTGGPGND